MILCPTGGRILPQHFRAPIALLSLLAATALSAQQAISLPPPAPAKAPTEATFRFVSDGPRAPGWSRPDEIPRAYFREDLPAFFTRTLQLDQTIPEHSTLAWIFTGPHAGFTIELSPRTVHLSQRFYDSTGLASEGNFPSRTTADDTRAYTGEARSLTVIVDAHLSINVFLNNTLILTQHSTFDVTRHQLMMRAPRTLHEISSGRLLRTPATTATITLDPAHTHQSILGFGGSPSIPAYASLSTEGKRQYFDLLQRYNLLIHREYPAGSELKPDASNADHPSVATPHYYGDNFPNGELSDFDYSRRILALGGSVLYEMWALPPYVTVPFHEPSGQQPTYDAWDKPVRSAADPEKYAALVIAFCKLAQQRAGAAPQIVGIQNEVEQPPEVFARMTTTLRRALDDAGFASTKIQIADAPFISIAIDRAKALHNSPEAWRATNFIAAHQYDYQQFLSNPDLYDDRLRALHAASDGKPFLATEICLNDPHAQEPSFRLAFAVAQLYYKDLTLLDAQALLYCWLLLDVEQPTFGGSRSLLVPDRTHGNLPIASSFQLRALGAFSRHLPHGMQRIDAHSSDPDLLATAFTSPHASTLILLNRGTEPRTLTLKNAATYQHFERTSLYAENSAEPLPANQPLTIQPGEILTLYTSAQ